jgi:hypothetical protein
VSIANVVVGLCMVRPPLSYRCHARITSYDALYRLCNTPVRLGVEVYGVICPGSGVDGQMHSIEENP